MGFAQIEKDFVRQKILPDFDWMGFSQPTQPTPLKKTSYPVSDCPDFYFERLLAEIAPQVGAELIHDQVSGPAGAALTGVQSARGTETACVGPVGDRNALADPG